MKKNYKGFTIEICKDISQPDRSKKKDGICYICDISSEHWNLECVEYFASEFTQDEMVIKCKGLIDEYVLERDTFISSANLLYTIIGSSDRANIKKQFEHMNNIYYEGQERGYWD